jgi:hypothetical protein
VLHGFQSSTSVTVGVRPHSRFESFVVCPGRSVEDLKGSFSSFGGDKGQTKEVVGAGKGPLAGTNGYSVSDSSLICRSHSDRFVQEVPALQTISSTKICVLIYQNGKVSSGAHVFVVVHLLREGPYKDPNFVL